MAVQFEPPPTWANPMLEMPDPATGEKKVTFNPVWLDWFLRLAALLSSGGGGGGSLGNVVGPASAVNNHLAVYDGATGKIIKDGGAPPTPVVFEDFETPVGVVDGVNTVFTLAHAPNPANSLLLFHKTGRLVMIGGTLDYTLAAAVITTTAAPAAGDVLYAWYRHF